MKNNSHPIRVRLAPSPTGSFHIGTARTALFNYLFAKKYGGVFVVRIEDTDQERSKSEYIEDIFDCLHWLGLDYDEGPNVGGEFGPYLQTERGAIYQKYLHQLIKEKKVYQCFCTSQELAAEREVQQKQGLAPRYSGKCRHLTAEQIQEKSAQGLPFAWRLKVEPQTLELNDLIYGELRFEAELFGDIPLTRAGGAPLFLFTNTVDDEAMKISHVLRGEDHLSNTAKQLLLCQALGLTPPQFGHLPLILNTDRTKMSKRRNPVSVSNDYRAKGFLPEALLNYMALLGWASGDDREIYTLDELVQAFSLERVATSGAIFDRDKLLWFNGYYIRQLSLKDLAQKARRFFKDSDIISAIDRDEDFYLRTVALVQERLKTLDEIEPLTAFFYRRPEYVADLLIAKKSDRQRTERALAIAEATMEKIDNFEIDALETALRQAAGANDLQDGELLWSVRVALSGSAASPGTFELLHLFGQKESLQRLQVAIAILNVHN